MDFSQYTRLTIPQGSVTQITDSGGNILWKEGLCAYRQLEYIHLSGAEHLETGFLTKQGYPKEFTFSFAQSSGDNFIIGCYDADLSANNRRRYYLKHNSTNTLSLVLGNTWQSTPTCNVNQKYVVRMNVYKDGNYKMEWQLYDEWGNQWDSNIIDSGSTSAPTTKLATIGANNSNSIEYPLVGNIYLVREWAGGTNGSFNYPTTNTIFYPAQRKSDGVCGLYRIDNNTFYPLMGTNTTTAAAGPTVCENPMWQRLTYTRAGGSGDTYMYAPGGTDPYSQEITIMENIPLNAVINVKCNIAITVPSSPGSQYSANIKVNENTVKSTSGTSASNISQSINQNLTLTATKEILYASSYYAPSSSTYAYWKITYNATTNKLILRMSHNHVNGQSYGVINVTDLALNIYSY